MQDSLPEDQKIKEAKPAKISNIPPASRSEILDALGAYISDGPSGLKAVIGTSKITLTREGRKQEFPRNAAIDSLIDAAVELTGPLTPQELESVVKNYTDRQIAMRIDGNTALFTRAAHVETFMGPKDKGGKQDMRQVRMRERTISASLDAPLSHIVRILDEMAMGGEIFE